MTTHEVLVKARARIAREEDWAQGYAVNIGVGPTCAGVAVDSVAGCPDFAARTEVLKAAGVMFDRSDPSLIPWNDAPGRTHAEVLAAFDRAIAATAPEPDLSWLQEPELAGSTEGSDGRAVRAGTA